ncbi:MAG: hypothetical protein AB7S81_07900 [Bdellovibrionales bacterium]
MPNASKKDAQMVTMPNQKKIIELQEGDCIYCGELCAPSIYCCTDPSPLTKEEAEAINKKGGYRKHCPKGYSL